jgi:hypothetical protein
MLDILRPGKTQHVRHIQAQPAGGGPDSSLLIEDVHEAIAKKHQRLL